MTGSTTSSPSASPLPASEHALAGGPSRVAPGRAGRDGHRGQRRTPTAGRHAGTFRAVRSDLAASHGEPSYVWRTGQQRRLAMIEELAPQLAGGAVLEVGCGLGLYLERLAARAARAVGVEYEPGRAAEAARRSVPASVLVAANESLPFESGSFDVVVSNEVIEHVEDDRASAAEMVRVLRPGGRLVLFCPNRWYPVEQHGVYWRGVYRFGNIPLVNYLPDPLRDRLAPHVRAYTLRRLRALFASQPVREVSHRRIFGGYDNVVARFGAAGRGIRTALQGAEGTPFDVLGLSHLLVLERVPGAAPGAIGAPRTDLLRSRSRTETLARRTRITR